MPNGESSHPFGEVPEIDMEMESFDPKNVKPVAEDAVGRAENRNANEFLMVDAKISGQRAARAAYDADSRGEVRPPHVNTPRPAHLKELSSDADSYPASKKELPDFGDVEWTD